MSEFNPPPTPESLAAETVSAWSAYLEEVAGRWQAAFPVRQTHRRTLAYLEGMCSTAPRKNSWRLAEVYGEANPYGFQHLLGRATWSPAVAQQALSAYVMDHLGDAKGVLLTVVVHPAVLKDRDGAKLVMAKLQRHSPRLQLVWAAAGYAGQLIEWVRELTGWELEIVKRPGHSHQFEVLPRRRVVARTCAWLGRCRRLSKDCEALCETKEAWVNIAMIQLMLCRLGPA